MNHILLVDDLSDALAMLQDAVRAAFGPVPCTLARSVHEALQVIDSCTPFDLALIDLALGDGSGLELIERLQSKQVQFVSKKEAIDTTTPTGKFMLTVFGAVAELEREYILQRQREGIAAHPKTAGHGQDHRAGHNQSDGAGEGGREADDAALKMAGESVTKHSQPLHNNGVGQGIASATPG